MLEMEPESVSGRRQLRDERVHVHIYERRFSSTSLISNQSLTRLLFGTLFPLNTSTCSSVI